MTDIKQNSTATLSIAYTWLPSIFHPCIGTISFFHASFFIPFFQFSVSWSNPCLRADDYVIKKFILAAILDDPGPRKLNNLCHTCRKFQFQQHKNQSSFSKTFFGWFRKHLLIRMCLCERDRER